MTRSTLFKYLLVGTVVGTVCLFACILARGAFTIFQAYQLVMPAQNRCTPPPEGFSEQDLVGTWASGSSEQSDTLIIREDGTYKQIIHIDYATKPDIDYETDWQPWRLEYVDDHPYLHLEGMRLCGIDAALSCEQPGGRGGWYDFCRDEFVSMDDEGILLVLGVPNENRSPNDPRPPPRWILLWVPMGSENTWTYHLTEP